MVQAALALCHQNGKFLYETLPDYFPQGRLTQVEVVLWSRFFEQQEQRRKR